MVGLMGEMVGGGDGGGVGRGVGYGVGGVVGLAVGHIVILKGVRPPFVVKQIDAIEIT